MDGRHSQTGAGVVPYDCKYNNDDIKELIDKQLDKMEDNYYTVITFDREY